MLKKLIQTIVPCVMLLAVSATANAQDKVSGNVTDQDGLPVVGATVLIVGTMNGTQTDFDGRWELQVPNPQSATLQFSCLGYETVEQAVGGRAVIDVTIAENMESLEEVVHVGYGTQKKVNLTGSVSTINFEEMAGTRTIVNTAAALAGLAPGMNVTQTSGQPGNESTTIRIRGTGSFTSSASSPLVLVDGVEWSMDNVNPNDIESISVLKDAASTAIYGTRAANGVILITTKLGETSKPRISYSFKGIWQNPYNNLELVTDYADFMELVNEANENADQSHTFSQGTIDLWREKSKDPNGIADNGLPNYMVYPNTDWFKEIFNTGFSQEHDISISGGSQKVRYLFTLSYLDNTGVMNQYDLDSSSQKATFRTNVEADVTKWFTVGAKIYGQYLVRGNSNVAQTFQYINTTIPGIYPGSPEKWGSVANSEDSPQANNAVASMAGSGGKYEKLLLNGTVYAKIRPYKGITIEGSMNYAPTLKMDHLYSTPTGFWDYVSNVQGTVANLDAATVTDRTYRDYYFNTDVLARYDAVFNKDHSLNVLLGYSTTNYLTWSYEVVKRGATDWSLNDGSTYAELYSSSHSAKSGWALRSYFARVNYALKDRYLFEANVRIDGSSVFGSENRYGVFPSFSAGWKIHDEPWMQSASNWLSELKLRASWGQAGNNQGIGNYTWQSTYDAGTAVVDGSNAMGFYISSMSNVNLKWETTSTTDIGIDAGFFKNRLTVGLDYYCKGTKDILYTPSTYLTMGDFSQVPANLGNMWNQGIEVALSWKDTAGKDFYYWVGVNASYNVNKVTNFKGTLVSGYDENGDYYTNFLDVAEEWSSPGYLIEGHKIGEHYIYQRYRGTGAGAVYNSDGTINVNAGPKDGMIRTESDMAWVRAMIDSGYTFNGVSTVSKDALWYGDFIYADLNGDGNYGNSYDRHFNGKSEQPTYNLGINFGFAWKGLEFSMLWTGAFDYCINWTTTYYNTSTAVRGQAIFKRIADNHYFYDPENPSDSRTNINGKYPRLWPSTVPINKEASDFYEYKGDYMKLKNVTVAYTLPQKWTRKFFVQQLKFYVSGENLLTITSYPGMDPELGTTIGYPLMRQYTLGAQITF